MSILKIITTVVIYSLIPFLYCHAQEYNKISIRAKAVIDSTYNALIKKNNIMGASIAIVENGEIVYAAGFGFADYAKKTKADEKTIYRIGSCTKPFTALSILQLQDRGLLNVNHSVKKYLPELNIPSRFNDNNQIYINDMLCHTSGLPCDISNGIFCDSPPNIDWVITQLNKQTTISPRLYTQAYSNVAYGLLGEVIARVGKTTYSEYVKENVFKPLNMNSSFIEYDKIFEGQISKGYYYEKKQLKEIKESSIRDVGAGMISSSAIDMANFMNMYLSNGRVNNLQFISKLALEDMKKNQLNNIELKGSETGGYGLYTKNVLVVGAKNDSANVKIIGHSGDTYAFHTDFGFIPELNIGVIILTNSNRGGWIASASELLKIYLKEEESKKLIMKDISKKENIEQVYKEETCVKADVIGRYNLGQFIINAKNDRKISFKQGPAKITFTQKKKDTTMYSAKAVAYGIIPINISDQEFKFVKMNGNVYVKVVFKESKNEEFVGIKSDPKSIPKSWKSVYGNYQAIDPVYKCKDCRIMNMEGMSVTIMEDKDFVLMKAQGKSADTKMKVYLNLISDSCAVTGGIGRGSGETVKLLANGNIYYSGFEFKRK